MGSVAVATDVTLPDAVIPKIEPDHEDYTSDSESSPEAESSLQAQGSEQGNADNPPVVKRKGGRKPVSHDI